MMRKFECLQLSPTHVMLFDVHANADGVCSDLLYHPMPVVLIAVAAAEHALYVQLDQN